MSTAKSNLNVKIDTKVKENLIIFPIPIYTKNRMRLGKFFLAEIGF